MAKNHSQKAKSTYINEKRRLKVLELRKKGWSLRRIAEKLKIGINTVVRDLLVFDIAVPRKVVGRDGIVYSKTTEKQREERRAVVRVLRMQKWSSSCIAEKLQVSRSTILNDIEYLEERGDKFPERIIKKRRGSCLAKVYNPKYTQEERAERRKRVIELRKKGWSYSKIAKEVGIEISTVKADLVFSIEQGIISEQLLIKYNAPNVYRSDEEIAARRKAVLCLRKKGWTYKRIAQEFNVSPAMIRIDLKIIAGDNDVLPDKVVGKNGRLYCAKRSTPEEIKERGKIVLKLREKGLSYKAIGEQLGISADAVAFALRKLEESE